ncbi:MAG: hypothetical protein H0W12_10110 [Chitinophagaceae bacterium]|jgi:hypothetical protein|nr:hypothetical protein [Chitinophagaceae bacterium]
MANKKVLQKDNLNKIEPGVTPVDKKVAVKKSPKKSSALLAASKSSSVVDAVNATSSRDVRGNSGLANTGTIISYD